MQGKTSGGTYDAQKSSLHSQRAHRGDKALEKRKSEWKRNGSRRKRLVETYAIISAEAEAVSVCRLYRTLHGPCW
jgi:hypothetical protein